MIIDTHTHFGEPSRPNDLLYRTELPGVYEELAEPAGVTGTVVVEARGGPDEVRWLTELADKDPFIVGIVGDIDPCSEDFGDIVKSFVGNPLLRGVRLHDGCCGGLCDLGGATTGRPSRTLLRSAETLAAGGLALDAHMTYEHFEGLIQVVERLPELRVVINHIAASRPLRAAGADPCWAEAIHRVAEYPGVYCKVSGLVQMVGATPAPGDVDYYRPTLDVLWEAFGEDRLVYGSNWPQIEAVSDFATAHRIVAEYFGSKGKRASERFFWRNARDVYRWARRA